MRTVEVARVLTHQKPYEVRVTPVLRATGFTDRTHGSPGGGHL